MNVWVGGGQTALFREVEPRNVRPVTSFFLSNSSPPWVNAERAWRAALRCVTIVCFRFFGCEVIVCAVGMRTTPVFVVGSFLFVSSVDRTNERGRDIGMRRGEGSYSAQARRHGQNRTSVPFFKRGHPVFTFMRSRRCDEGVGKLRFPMDGWPDGMNGWKTWMLGWRGLDQGLWTGKQPKRGNKKEPRDKEEERRRGKKTGGPRLNHHHHKAFGELN